AVARARGSPLLIGADPAMAETVGAAGVHLTERRAGEALGLKAAHPGWIVTAAAHSPLAVTQAGAAGADAVLLSTVF
ncbi:thiamine phosphate synthase, partial [Acinetobacter baumannii]